MRRSLAAIAAAALLLSSVGTASAAPPDTGPGTIASNPQASDNADPTGRWIVVLKSGTDVTAAIANQGRRIGFATDHTYRNAIRGYAAKLSHAQVIGLSRDPSVEMIV